MAAADGVVSYQVVENLVSNDAGHLERLLGRDRVNDHIAMDADEVLRVQNAVLILQKVRGEASQPLFLRISCSHTVASSAGGFSCLLNPQPCRSMVPPPPTCPRNVTYLAGGIDDFGSIVLALVADDLAERIFDGRVVALDKVAVYELHGERRFTCASKQSSACESGCGAESSNKRETGRCTDRAAADNCTLALLRRGRHLGERRSGLEVRLTERQGR